MRAGLTPAHFVRPTDDYFRDMDDNLVHGKRPVFTQAEIEGRNMWLVWTGGNDRLWDRLTIDSLGSFDLLKTISSHPRSSATAATTAAATSGSSTSRASREATGPDPNRFGLWLDVRDPNCPPDPFADAKRTIPGVKIGARGTTVPVGSYYGEPTGIVGLRLFPNPDFDEKARRRWNSDRFYNDPSYYSDPRSRPAVPRRHVVRVLSRRPEPDQAAGRSREPDVGEPELDRRRPVFLVGPRLQLAGRQQRRAASSIRRCTSRGPARSTRRSSRPTTSTIRGR